VKATPCDCLACVENRCRYDAGWTTFDPLPCDKSAATAREKCPDCGREKAKNAYDAMAGLCPKWWAVTDEMAQRDCDRVREYYAARATMKNGIELIADERTRQISEEGWTPEHDDGHDEGELSAAASVYAEIASLELPICALIAKALS
jgi:hypothetical protein